MKLLVKQIIIFSLITALILASVEVLRGRQYVFAEPASTDFFIETDDIELLTKLVQTSAGYITVGTDPILLQQAKAANDYYKAKLYTLLELDKQKFFEKCSQEYYEATYVWCALEAAGYNDYVIAGIMGNLMAETGGQTLALNHKLSTKSYYGLAQWSKKYNQGITKYDLDTQCQYLINTIETALNAYGKNYAKGFDFITFLNLQNEQDAALAFAKCYERCSSGSYVKRQKNATKAYEYFVVGRTADSQ